MSRSMPLAALLQGVCDVPARWRTHVASGLSQDSRVLSPGGVFVALPGARRHGLDFAAEARANGAACILFEPPAPAGIDGDDLIAVPNLRQQLGVIADRYYGSPSAALTVVGVTGTNGKTSTVQLLAQALSGPPHGPCGHIGTLGIGLGEWLAQPSERTTPDVISVHAALAELRDRGARSVAMEVSSHALAQGRVDGVRFDVAVFSNLTHDHLDYHGSMEAYGAAKAKLFAWPTLRAAVINIDDGFGRELCGRIAPAVDLWTVAVDNAAARLRACDVSLGAGGLAYELREGQGRQPSCSGLLGRFNVDNLLAVAGCLRALGWPLPQVAAQLGRLRPVRGRMQRIGGGMALPLLVVDYAHSPDALRQALASLRAHTRGRLICVFGCGGERDRGKRPVMAAVAEAGADAVIVTDDNPRNENGDAIVAEIMAGFSQPQAVRVRRDRAQAIALAVAEAVPGDTVLIAGKGHEAYQEFAGERRAFDDAQVAKQCLEQRA